MKYLGYVPKCLPLDLQYTSSDLFVYRNTGIWSSILILMHYKKLILAMPGIATNNSFDWTLDLIGWGDLQEIELDSYFYQVRKHNFHIIDLGFGRSIINGVPADAPLGTANG